MAAVTVTIGGVDPSIVRALAEGRADDLAVLLRQHVRGVGRLLTVEEGDLTDPIA